LFLIGDEVGVNVIGIGDMSTRLVAIHLSFVTSLALVNAGWASEARITQLVKEAKVLVLPDNIERPVSIDDVLRAQNILSTGSDALAELRMEGRTVIRAGAKSTFSVDEQGRVLNLRQGSLLVSALDKEENTIETPLAQVTVQGATVIVSSAPGEVGFKLLVDEGVAKVKFANGTSRMLKAGEMTLVRSAEARGIKSVPIQPFQLERQIKTSRLIRGFLEPLPSQVKLVAAITAQRYELGQLGQKSGVSLAKAGTGAGGDVEFGGDTGDTGGGGKTGSGGGGGGDGSGGSGIEKFPKFASTPGGNPHWFPPDQFALASVFTVAVSPADHAGPLSSGVSVTTTALTAGGTITATTGIGSTPVSTVVSSTSFTSSMTSPTVSRTVSQITANVSQTRVLQLQQQQFNLFR
jgi:hypothetical protein